MDTYNYFVLAGIIQLLHSQEEIWTNFHAKWFVITMPRPVFISFETLLSLAIIAYMLEPSLPAANYIMPFFILVMFVNGIGHIVWALIKKSYVPGLVTSPLFVVVFISYFVSLI